VRLHPGLPADWIAANSVIAIGAVERVNHGVASGTLFIEQAASWATLPNQPSELRIFLNWAATAMALHSLKYPGAQRKYKLSLKADPLSFLLMLCDEMQVWDRERPDETEDTASFRRVELGGLDIGAKTITARITYIPHRGAEPKTEAVDLLRDQINKDNSLLFNYIDPDPYSVSMWFDVQGIDAALPSLDL
jgi:hypothetical protein